MPRGRGKTGRNQEIEEDDNMGLEAEKGRGQKRQRESRRAGERQRCKDTRRGSAGDASRPG